MVEEDKDEEDQERVEEEADESVVVMRVTTMGLCIASSK